MAYTEINYVWEPAHHVAWIFMLWRFQAHLGPFSHSTSFRVHVFFERGSVGARCIVRQNISNSHASRKDYCVHF